MTTDERKDPARDFVDAVRQWHETDKGRLAALRRCAGDTIAGALDGGRGIAWFFGLLDRFGRTFGDENAFLVATLLAFDRRTLDGGLAAVGSFGRTMAALKAKPDTSDDGIDRRFGILLDADFDPRSGGGELPFRLRQTVKLALSKEVRVDWAALLWDLNCWNDPDKPVQKRWARDYYAAPAPADGAKPLAAATA